MGSFWKGIQSDEHIWEHEWTKHGTCVSTLEPECYGDEYVETEEVVDYFGTAVEIFQTLPTYYVRFFPHKVSRIKLTLNRSGFKTPESCLAKTRLTTLTTS